MKHDYLIENGWIGRTRSSEAGDSAFTGVYIAGDIVGADGVLSERLDDDLIALSDGSVLQFATGALRTFVSTDADAAIVLVSLLVADSGFLREALFATGRMSSCERLSTFVLQTYVRLISAGLIAEDARSFDLLFSQTQLAAVTGVTPVHINRTLQLLRGAGYLDVRNGRVEIHDLEGLRREAQSGSIGSRGRAAPSR